MYSLLQQRSLCALRRTGHCVRKAPKAMLQQQPGAKRRR